MPVGKKRSLDKLYLSQQWARGSTTCIRIGCRQVIKLVLSLHSGYVLINVLINFSTSMKYIDIFVVVCEIDTISHYRSGNLCKFECMYSKQSNSFGPLRVVKYI